MNKSFSLETFMNVYNDDNQNLLNTFLTMVDNQFGDHGEVRIPSTEPEDLKCLLDGNLSKLHSSKKDGYFWGIKIGRKLDEEFDILRFGTNSIVNIELKSDLSKDGLASLRDQLRRHKRVLQFLEENLYLYVYIRSNDEIYKLSDNEELISCNFDEIMNDVEESYIDSNRLEELDMTNLIISPYTDPDEFSKRNYQLIQQQKSVKQRAFDSTKKFISIKGRAGTGKSLVLFDLAKKYIENDKDIILYFTGQLDEYSIITDSIGFNVKPIKFFSENEANKYDIVMFDEAQRLYPAQYKEIITFNNEKIIFCYDPAQTLSFKELGDSLESNLKELDNHQELKLKDNIRAKPEIYDFISRILEKNARFTQPHSYNNDINLVYFNKKEEASIYIQEKCENEEFVSVELSSYTTRSTNKVKRAMVSGEGSKTAHQVIGREFNNVLVTIDEHFYYDSDGILKSDYQEYYPYLEREGILQAMTRAKNKLVIVIINNPEVMEAVKEIYTFKYHRDKKLKNIGVLEELGSTMHLKLPFSSRMLKSTDF